jgi:hypothetical protein
MELFKKHDKTLYQHVTGNTNPESTTALTNNELHEMWQGRGEQ